jgi:hypothetical protein
MIEPSFRTLLVPAIGAAPLTEASLPAAGEAAIALSAVAVGTEKKDRAAFAAQAKPLPEKYLPRNRHACPQAGLDKDDSSVAG